MNQALQFDRRLIDCVISADVLALVKVELVVIEALKSRLKIATYSFSVTGMCNICIYFALSGFVVSG